MQNKIRLLASLLLSFLFLLSVGGISEPGCGVEGNFKIVEEKHKASENVELVFVYAPYDECGNTQIYLTNSGTKTATEMAGIGIILQRLARQNELNTGLAGNFLDPGSTTPPLLFFESFRGKDIDSVKVSVASAEGATAEAIVVLEKIKTNPRIEDLLILAIPVLLVLLPILAALIYKFFKGYKLLGRNYALVIVAGLWIVLFYFYLTLLLLS